MKEKKPKSNKSEIEKFSSTALYFGFRPGGELAVSLEDSKMAEKIIKNDNLVFLEKNLRKTEDLVSILNKLSEENKENRISPGLLTFTEKIKTNQKHRRLFLEILGDNKSFSDVLIIKTAIAILKEVPGNKKLKISINSLGDREAINRFNKEFHNYYKKQISKLPLTCKNNLRIDPFSVLDCPHIQCQKIAENAPKPFSFLSEAGRKYFKEVLEDLEETDIDYEINEKMTINKAFVCQTVFIIKNQNGEILAEGGRYNVLSRKMGRRKEIPAVGATLLVPNTTESARNQPEPKIFFIQIGAKAKIKSLEIIDHLRKNKILMMQSLTKDKISAQLNIAERLNLPYALILGQQETIEKVIILRNLKTREQRLIKFERLVEDLKKYL